MSGADELLERVVAERRRAGRGTLKSRRDLWRFCARAFREWAGIHAVADVPSVVARRLTAKELAAWVRLAEELPAVARDVLALQRSAVVRGEHVSLREMRWPPEKVDQLIELTRFALIGARDEEMRAEIRLRTAEREAPKFANGAQRVAHARKMVTAIQRHGMALADAADALADALVKV